MRQDRAAQSSIMAVTLDAGRYSRFHVRIPFGVSILMSSHLTVFRYSQPKTMSTSLANVGSRRCSKPSCSKRAVATLTYVYADSTAVLGPLATFAEPHCYDLCEDHAARMTAPRGWDVVRLAPDPEALKPSVDDIEALANAVREVGRVEPADEMVEVNRRGHLRVLRDSGQNPIA
jgi:hypothetical protein